MIDNPAGYAIGGSTYVKLRDLAALLNGSEKQSPLAMTGNKRKSP
jgi:hypothetical protein